MFDQKRDSETGRVAAGADSTTSERIRLLEEALAEYIERYGLSKLAREALAPSDDGSRPPT